MGGLRVLMVVPALAGSGEPPVWAARQIESLANCNISTDTFIFRDRRSVAGLARGVRSLRKRVAQFRPELIHVHYGGAQALAAVAATRLPVVVSFCGSDLLGNYTPGGRPTMSGRLSVALSRAASVKATRCIAKSDQLRARLPAHQLRAKCDVIPNGVDLSLFYPRPQAEARRMLGWRHGRPVAVFFERRAAWVKNPELARSAVAVAQRTVPELELVTVSGLPHTQVPVLFAAADVLLLTSRHEGSSNALKEALACNLPVVSTACGDAVQRLASVQNCYVCPPDPTQMGARIAEVAASRHRSDGVEYTRDFDQAEVARQVRLCYERALRTNSR